MNNKREALDERPPLFRRWRTWYYLLMIALFLQIGVYFLITTSFS